MLLLGNFSSFGTFNDSISIHFLTIEFRQYSATLQCTTINLKIIENTFALADAEPAGYLLARMEYRIARSLSRLPTCSQNHIHLGCTVITHK